MTNELYTRIEDRVMSMGFSPKVAKRKLKPYAHLKNEEDPRLSALDFHNLAEDMMTTFHWAITGEIGDDEVRMSVRNCLTGPDSDQPGRLWIQAEKILRDVVAAYQQVSLGPSEAFGLSEPENFNYAEALLRERATGGSDLDFFGIVEQIFGVDIFVIDSDAQDWGLFDALGAIVGQTPCIVVRRGINTEWGHRAVAHELAKIISGNLFRYSDVFRSHAPLNLWEVNFAARMIDYYNELGLAQGDDYENERFPQRLIDAHREAVAKGENHGSFLNWMAGDPMPEVKHSSSLNLDEWFANL